MFSRSSGRGGSRTFFRRGCTCLLLYFNTNKPHSFFFLLNTSCIRKPQVISGGVHTLCTPPRSAPEWRLFLLVFRGGRTKGQEVMTSNVDCHAMLWTENSNEHPTTRDQQKHDLEIPQNWLVWSGSPLMIVQNSWIFLIYEIYLEYGTAAI